jgi:uncharacterized protein YdeI (YjbR/CyaY-like superfamily)
MNPKVDAFISNSKNWKPELEILRKIILDCNLFEDIKWGVPCYTYQNSNIIIIQGFKAYCGLSFFKGALLNDANQLLVKPGENTQSGRLIRFTNTKEIVALETVLKAYIFESIELEKKGLKVDFVKDNAHVITEEFQIKLNKNPDLKKAFESLTPGRQRAYNLFFSAAKQSKTREVRIEKYTQQILNGKGINDCTCGLSKKMPYCDGSHGKKGL